MSFADEPSAAVISLERRVWSDTENRYKTYWGSGFAIKANIILTAGHNIQDDTFGRIEQVAIRMGSQAEGPSQGKKVDVRYGIRITVHREWKKGLNDTWDMRHDQALLLVDSPFKNVKPAAYEAPPHSSERMCPWLSWRQQEASDRQLCRSQVRWLHV